MHSDRLGSIGGIKGKVKVQLFDAETNNLDFEVEKNNLIMSNFSKIAQQMTVYNIGSNLGDGFDYSVTVNNNIDRELTSLDFFGALFLNADDTEPSADEKHIKKMLGYASRSGAYSGADTMRGTINQLESKIDYDNNRARLVFDFPTHAANGSFQSVGFMANNFAVSPALGKLFVRKRRDLIAVDRAALSAIYTNDGPIIRDRLGNLIALPGATNVKPVKLNVPSFGEFTQFADFLKSESGVAIAVFNAKTLGDKLFVLTSGGKICVYNDSANIDGVHASNAYVIPVGTVPLASFTMISDTVAIVSSASATVDAVTGEPFRNYLYVLNITTGIISRRIRRGDVTQYGYPYDIRRLKPLLIYNSTTGLLKVVTPDISGTSKNRFVSETYDYAADGDEFMYASAMYQYICDLSLLTDTMFELDDNGYAMTWAVSLTSFNASKYSTLVTASKVGIYEICDDMYLQSRVLLPAPVTKLNTQTLKITYDIIFEPGLTA